MLGSDAALARFLSRDVIRNYRLYEAGGGDLRKICLYTYRPKV